MLIYDFSTVSEVLNGVYAERRARNPRYSLRALARDLDVSPSTLSEVLSGQRVFSVSRTLDLGKRLGLNSSQIEFLVALATRDQAKNPEDRREAEALLNRYRYDAPAVVVSREQHELYGSWEPTTILEALKLRNCPRTAAWLADAIGIEEARVVELCGLLVKHRFLVDCSDGTYRVAVDRSSTVRPGVESTPESTLRRGHASLLAEASTALESQSVDERDFSAIIYATSKSRAPEVKEAIKGFRRAIAAAAENDEEKDSVYCIAVNWFKLASTPGSSKRTDQV